jgi:hypothetical protein
VKHLNLEQLRTQCRILENRRREAQSPVEKQNLSNELSFVRGQIDMLESLPFTEDRAYATMLDLMQKHADLCENAANLCVHTFYENGKCASFYLFLSKGVMSFKFYLPSPFDQTKRLAIDCASNALELLPVLEKALKAQGNL